MSEPVFVPRPGAADEDDGAVLSFLTRDSDPHYAAVVVLDGRTMEETARVAFRNERGEVTATLHGTFGEGNQFK